MKSIQDVVILGLLMAALSAAEIRDKGWWRNMVFYQIYPRSFMDSDGDGVGDLKGITQNLNHFKDAGVGGIWLSPINKSPMVDFGYDISDFRDIDPLFGTLSDFEKLVNASHEFGLKVILDLVPNHSSDKHNWFKESQEGRNNKYKDYYVWADGVKKNNTTIPPNNWISLFSGPAWTYSDKREQYYLHQFAYQQPDLNYTNPDVKKEMEDIITFWLDKGVDGFRIDAVPHIFEDEQKRNEPKSNAPGSTDKDYTYLNHIYTKDHPKTYELIQSWRNLVDNYAKSKNQSEKILMTEAYTSLNNTVKYYKYGSHVPFNFNFIMEVNASSTAIEFKRLIDNWVGLMPNDTVANWVMGNHDRSRTASRYPGRGDQMTMLSMILPGIAVTYNGEEIGMVDKTDISWKDTKDPQACNAGKDKYRSRSRDPNRTPFQWNDSTSAGFSKNKTTWLPVHENYKTLNLAKQKKDSESHYKVYKALTSMRHSSEALQKGDLITDVLNDEVLVVVRSSTKETVTLLINFSTQKEQTVNLAALISKKGTTKAVLRNVGSTVTVGEPLQLSTIKIPANDTIVLISLNSGAMSLVQNSLLFILLIALTFTFRL